MVEKVVWHGEIVGVQPRIRLLRSFDQRSHTYLGYVLQIDGEVGGEQRTFCVAIGKGAHAKHRFQGGCVVSGLCEPVPDSRLEAAEFYKASRLKVLVRPTSEGSTGSPWVGVPPGLEVYRARGHRRLDPRTYSARCVVCVWGCRMPVEMIVDHWKPSVRRYRFETFCYGPKSCLFYKAGSVRGVPGRRGMSWKEEDWVDEEATSHRGPDD